jgi:hypothetical protein
VELLAATMWRGCPWVLTDGSRWQHRVTSAWCRRVDDGTRGDSKTVKAGRSRVAEDAMLPARHGTTLMRHGCDDFSSFLLCYWFGQHRFLPVTSLMSLAWRSRGRSATSLCRC